MSSVSVYDIEPLIRERGKDVTCHEMPRYAGLFGIVNHNLSERKHLAWETLDSLRKSRGRTCLDGFGSKLHSSNTLQMGRFSQPLFLSYLYVFSDVGPHVFQHVNVWTSHLLGEGEPGKADPKWPRWFAQRLASWEHPTLMPCRVATLQSHFVDGAKLVSA